MAQCESSYKWSTNPMIIMGTITDPTRPICVATDRASFQAKEYVSPHCINCKYLDEDKCTYFKRFRISKSKQIPWNIKEKGCKVYMPKWSKEHPLLDYILDLFK